MRTGISEDTKGDPTKHVGNPDGPKRRPPGVEPLLPEEDLDAAPSAQSDEEPSAMTYADRVEGGPEHPPDDDCTSLPTRAPE